MSNRPRSRERKVTDNGKQVYRRGDGLGTGPVGNRKSSGNGGGGSLLRSPISILALIFMLLFGGGNAIGGLFGGSSSQAPSTPVPQQTQPQTPTFTIPVATPTYATETSTTSVDTTVAKGSREKYTTILGNGKDVTTIMLYLCGTDLESRGGMATNDLREIASATPSDNINIIVYTGGCANWKVNGISNNVNQIYQIKDGRMYTLEQSMGSKSMTDPNTLTEFIKYCAKNFPANRYDLILWDHGGGSVSGYGYDQNYRSMGAMNLANVDKALTAGGVKFDFVGYDACLMATAENALMLNKHADYLIASEETEPGIGWYYTNWLSAYAKNPSMDTLSIGKNIIDDFVEECGRKVRGQSATLSIIDLAEFNNVVPDKLKSFAMDTSKMIQDKNYKTVAVARQNAREFSTNKIDQVDLVDLAKKLDTNASNDLANALLNSIKYNRTSGNMSNAYGVSIYFPNHKLGNVDRAVAINGVIGMDEEYNSCMKEYASLQLAGQTVAQQTNSNTNPYSLIFGDYTTGQSTNTDMTTQFLESLLYTALGGREFVAERSMPVEDTALYITENQFNSNYLRWENVNGVPTISLPEEQWALVTNLEMNMFYDDGEGYIDLGCDNVFDLDENGNLIAESEPTWLAINGQPVSYYHTSTAEYENGNYTISGYIPVYLNNERAKLLVEFNQDEPYGIILGAQLDYRNNETDTLAKLEELVEGDILDFVCDYYDYNGNYTDSYYLGDSMVVESVMELSNVRIGKGAMVTYKFTDIYANDFWTPVVE